MGTDTPGAVAAAVARLRPVPALRTRARVLVHVLSRGLAAGSQRAPLRAGPLEARHRVGDVRAQPADARLDACRPGQSPAAPSLSDG